MIHHAITSSNIASIAHERTTMHVTFRHGGTYEYLDVSKEDFNELLNSKSPGKHLNLMGIKGKRIDKPKEESKA